MFRHAACDMSMVMLNRKTWCSVPSGALLRVPRAGIVRMKVMDNQLRRNSKQVLEKRDISLKRLKCREIIEIPEMLAEYHRRAAAQREGRFQLPTDRERRNPVRRAERQRLRRVPSRAPHECKSTFLETNDRVVTTDANGSIVSQKQVRD